MRIGDLSRLAGVPTGRIRFYESLGILDRPRRSGSGYREYAERDAETLRFVVGARQLGIPLAGVGELLETRRRGEPPCGDVLKTLENRIGEVDRRIGELLDLRESLTDLRDRGLVLRQDDVEGESCVCYLVKTYRGGGRGE